MTATYVGSMTIGAAVPGAAVSASAGAGGINAAFPDIAARVAALQAQLAALAVMPPLPSFADMLAQAVTLTSSIELAIATPGLPPPPSIATAIAALIAIVTSLETMAVALQAQLAVIVSFQTALARAGVHVVAFDGLRSELGAHVSDAIDDHITNPNAHTRALVLATTSGTTWSVMGQVFKVTP